MFLKLNHQQLDIYATARHLVKECYWLTKVFPLEERFNMVSQIRRAALSVHLNIAEGATRKSEVERKRFYEVARGSVVEIDAALDIASDLQYLNNYDLDRLGSTMIKTFKILSGLIGH